MTPLINSGRSPESAVIAVPESAVLAAVIDVLLWQYHALIIRVNSGVSQPVKENGDTRFVTFNTWQALGLDKQRSGVSDVLALLPPPPGAVVAYPEAVGKWPERVTLWGLFLAVECKAPGKLKNVTAQQRLFLDEVASRGGLAVVCDDVEILIAELEKRGY